MARLDDHDRAQISDLAAGTVRGCLPLLVAVGDPEFGALLLDAALELVLSATEDLVAMREPLAG